jgi:hypothetical protein
VTPPNTNATSELAVTRMPSGSCPLLHLVSGSQLLVVPFHFTKSQEISSLFGSTAPPSVVMLRLTLLTKALCMADCSVAVYWLTGFPASWRDMSRATTSARACMSLRTTRCPPRSTAMAAMTSRTALIATATMTAAAPRSSFRCRRLTQLTCATAV